MKIIAVDDEHLALDYMISLLEQVIPGNEIAGFRNSKDALSYLAQNKVELAFLDIEMGNMNGLEFAKMCKDLCPQINIIFVTGYSQYTMEAFKMHASGYLMKPVRAEDLRMELNNLRNPLPCSIMERVRILTFGNFEIFVDGEPLKMPQAKCKECLAYLVDRKGAQVRMAEIAAILWEDKLYDRTVQNNLHRVISDMMKVLRNEEVQDIVIKRRSEMAIDTTKVDCDYYRAISGDITQMNAFIGEYMSNYSWAEFTLGELTKKKEK